MFVFDVICSVCLRNGYVIVLKSVSHMCLLTTVRLCRTRYNVTKATRKFYNDMSSKFKSTSFFWKMHHLTLVNSDGNHWYVAFIIFFFLVTLFKDLSKVHTIVYLKKLISIIPTFTPTLFNQHIESLSTICL